MTHEERKRTIERIVDRAYPYEGPKWKESRVRLLMGETSGERRPRVTKDLDVQKKKSQPVPAYVKEAMADYNRRMAAIYGIENPDPEIQYR